VQQSPPGYSILVVEDELFIARCLQIVLPYRHEAWPNAPVMGKLASGAQIVEALRGLLQPPPASMRGRRRYRCGCERPDAPCPHYGRCRRTDEAATERWAAPSSEPAVVMDRPSAQRLEPMQDGLIDVMQCEPPSPASEVL